METSILDIYKNAFINLSAKNKTLVLKKLISKRHFDLTNIFPLNNNNSSSIVNYLISRDTTRHFICAMLDNSEYAKQIKAIKKEIDTVYKETGIYNCYIANLFLRGNLSNGFLINAPLLLFPVSIFEDNGNWYIQNLDSNILLNSSVVLAYQQFNEIKLDNFDSEFSGLDANYIAEVLLYLKNNGLDFTSLPLTSTVAAFSPIESDENITLQVVNNFILGQFAISQTSIMQDYIDLKTAGVTPGIFQNIMNKNSVISTEADFAFTERNISIVNELDLSQKKALLSAKKYNELVIYGPPGTGKSQVISNIIADNLAQNKKVLLVSQKKAALDVVYNRLTKAKLNNYIAYAADYTLDQQAIFNKLDTILNSTEIHGFDQYHYHLISSELDKGYSFLNRYNDTLNKKSSFGLSINEVISNSSLVDTGAFNYSTVEQYSYEEILRVISKAKSMLDINSVILSKLNFVSNISFNMFEAILSNISTVATLANDYRDDSVKISNYFSSIEKSKYLSFTFWKAKAYFKNLGLDFSFAKEIFKLLSTETELLKVIETLNNNKSDYLKVLTLNPSEQYILNFIVQNPAIDIVNVILNAHLQNNAEYKKLLSLNVEIPVQVKNIKELNTSKVSIAPDFIIENIKNKINSNLVIKKKKDTFYSDIKHEIKKKRKKLSLRQFVHEFHNKGLFDLMPCWLATPEVVSAVFPLVEGLFDLVIFDEASQLFIENALPSIYRANSIIVAGDDKQLKPTELYSAKFEETMDHYLLENISLLDVAKINYKSISLENHYRSHYSELIEFSNKHFYNGNMQICPNRNVSAAKAIELIKVKGTLINRQNKEEAIEIVKLLTKIFATKDENETVGIIAFSITQKEAIEKLIDQEAELNPEFNRLYSKECVKTTTEEDTSLFIKNIENVQGDERDIIIFSTGYAPDESGVLALRFGSLNQEGGENRLNVAITRAKKKVYLVTSISSSDLHVDNSKNAGPKLFKEYLSYAESINSTSAVVNANNTPANSFIESLKSSVINHNFEIILNYGNANCNIDIAFKNKATGNIDLAILFDDNIALNYIYKSSFLSSRDYKILNISKVDIFNNPDNVISEIISNLI